MPVGKEICGFLSLEQAMRWFTEEEIDSLYEEGYQLIEIKVKKITAIGEKQVLGIR